MTERGGELKFEVDARHIRQLGRELVADTVTAVSELIKNAYDADATLVTVTFSDDAAESSGGTLTITDDGAGMTLADVAQRWMVISTNSKRVDGVSEQFGRARAGQKGIGRFSVESLGAQLSLSSTVSGSADRVTVEFDWGEYAEGLSLDEVSNRYEISRCEPDEHGTVLEISDLHDAWGDRHLKRVRDAVFLLQPPFAVREVRPAGSSGDGFIEDPGFRVAVGYELGEESTSVPGDVDDVHAAATAWLRMSIDDRGRASAHLTSQHLGIDEKREFDQRLLTPGALEASAAYFVFRRDALNPTSSVGVRRAQALADRFGGIRVYRDGMRIMPYGQPGNDWLGLDALYRKRSAVLAPIGNSNFFGEVLLTRDSNLLIVDTASREGVVENEAFVELRDFLRNSMVWAVGLVAEVRQRKVSAGDKPHKPETRDEVVGPVVDAAKSVAAAETDEERAAAVQKLIVVATEAEQRARAADDRAEQERRDLIDELSLLRVLASLGGSVAVFGHEVRAVVNQAEAALGDVADHSSGDEAILGPLEQAERQVRSLGDLASYLDVYVSHSGRRDRDPQPVADIVRVFANQVGPLLSRRGVDIESSVEPAHLRTAPMARSELEAVFFNLLTNSIRAMDSDRVTTRMVRIEARQDRADIVVRFLDTGRGIEEPARDRVFDAFYTTSTAADAELGHGTGLGLKIVSDIAAANGGSVAVVDPPGGFSTCIEVRVAGQEATDDA